MLPITSVHDAAVPAGTSVAVKHQQACWGVCRCRELCRRAGCGKSARPGSMSGEWKRSTRQQLNAPFDNPCPPEPEEIEVTDPTHPLYGQRFQVRSLDQPLHGTAYFVVAYRDSLRLRIPVLVTNLAPGHLAAARTKFTREAIQELLSLVEECILSCPNNPQPSGTASRHACNNRSRTTSPSSSRR